MTLTAGGRRLVPIASQMVALAAEADDAIRQAQGAPERLRVVATSTVAESVAPGLLAAFGARGRGDGGIARGGVDRGDARPPAGTAGRRRPRSAGAGARRPRVASRCSATGCVRGRRAGPSAGRRGPDAGRGRWPPRRGWSAPTPPTARSPVGAAAAPARRPRANVRVFASQAAAWAAAVDGQGVAPAVAHLVANELARHVARDARRRRAAPSTCCGTPRCCGRTRRSSAAGGAGPLHRHTRRDPRDARADRGRPTEPVPPSRVRDTVVMTDFDLVVRGATIVDGTGAPAVDGDLAVRDGVIASVGPRVDGRGAEEIDGRGLVLAPGLHRPAHASRRQPVLGSRADPVVELRRDDRRRPPTAGTRWRPSPTTTARAYVDIGDEHRRADPRSPDPRRRPLRLGRPRVLRRPARSCCRWPLNHAHADRPRAPRVPRCSECPTCTNGRRRPRSQQAMCRLLAEGLALGALGFSTDQVIGNPGPGGTALPGQVCGPTTSSSPSRPRSDGGPGPGCSPWPTPRCCRVGPSARRISRGTSVSPPRRGVRSWSAPSSTATTTLAGAATSWT